MIRAGENMLDIMLDIDVQHPWLANMKRCWTSCWMLDMAVCVKLRGALEPYESPENQGLPNNSRSR